jgi:hypothetical protein
VRSYAVGEEAAEDFEGGVGRESAQGDGAGPAEDAGYYGARY